MNWFSKFVIFILILISCFWVKDTFFPQVSFKGTGGDLGLQEKLEKLKPNKEGVELELSDEGKRILGDPETKQKLEKTARIYFVKTSEDGTTKMYASKRELSELTLSNAVKTLLKGPTAEERKQGVYSEIPAGTKLRGITESDDKIIIDLNDTFEYGAGTESVNNRLKQLAKTVVAISPDKNIYLYIEGKQVDVMGGDGIMIPQPINASDFSF